MSLLSQVELGVEDAKGAVRLCWNLTGVRDSMDELQYCGKIKWIGGDSTGQDVSIHLVTDHGLERSHGHKTVAVVMIHSHVLITYSKYFKACLSERWATPIASSDFVLDVEASLDAYFDCFDRMGSPLLKNFQVLRDFRDVKSSLELLKVASRIEFHELMDSISRYLSSVLWSTEDEIRIREYTTSSGFSRSHGEDLVERLGLDESEEDRHAQLCDVIQQCVRTALSFDGAPSLCSRAFLTEFLQGVGSAAPSNFAKTVVMLINREAKDMFDEFAKDWKGKMSTQVHSFKLKLEAMFWVLDAMLRTDVAEELVESFAQLDVQQILIGVDSSQPWPRSALGIVAIEDLAKLVVCVYRGVVTGQLLLKTPARVALLVLWHPLLRSKLSTEVYDEATKQLFMTLPLKNQMELLKLYQTSFDDYVTTSSLISTLSKGCNWQAMKLDFK